MITWMALPRRIDFGRRQPVLTLGATGNAGRMAIRVAKRLGAVCVIRLGRNAPRLAELGALGGGRDTHLRRTGQAAEVDVVLDYV
jgi:NADPH:quinone reductase-like Zn-dependent oxidoreductase